MFAEPLLNFFALRREYYTLPFHDAGAGAVFRHHIRRLIEDLDEAVRLCPFEMVRRGCSLVFLHLLLE